MGKTYRALTGIEYKVAGKEKRIEAGAEVSDLPASSIDWLTKCGAIEEVIPTSANSATSQEGGAA